MSSCANAPFAKAIEPVAMATATIVFKAKFCMAGTLPPDVTYDRMDSLGRPARASNLTVSFGSPIWQSGTAILPLLTGHFSTVRAAH
ncbi:MAG: hypothetical protein A49_21920 [Methyloceanibacter sp.]|nr:MAG: hypothetical protein A49_21920 [Methyloceanibacter sp.]